MIPVIQHAIRYVENDEKTRVDWVCLLQPTEPFRTVQDIEQAMTLAQAGGCDSVISVVQVFSVHPILMKRIDAGRLLPYCIEEKEGTRRQDYSPAAYMRNGAIYLSRRDVLMERHSLWGDVIHPYVMPPERSVGVDSELDLKLVELLMQEQLALKSIIMCGISGIVGEGWERSQLEAMVAIQDHRGPDDNGIYVNASGLVGLGHNRLSIVDLTDAGHQPMVNRDRTVWIVFNGEIYNYLELRQELKGYPFRSRTDTEVILAAYERWGENCVEHFVGMFAFAIWDERTKSLFCARDRLGIKPFHYAWHQNAFLFASEIKAILAADFRAEPNRKVWATYLTHGIYDHGPETFFAGICTLPPGHTLKVCNGEESVRCYWHLPTVARERLILSDDEAGARFWICWRIRFACA